jgi:hypothetical protein
MDRDSKLIFENYKKALVVESWSYNPNNGQTALQNQDPNGLIDVGTINNLLAKAGDPSSIIRALLWLSRQNTSQYILDLVKAYLNFYKSGETGNLKIKINETCEKSLNDAKQALETIISSSTSAKQQGKPASFIGSGLDMNLRKIENSLNNIIDLEKQYNSINERELQKQSTGANVLPTDTLSPKDYFKQFATFLTEKGVSRGEPTNVSETVKNIADYITTLFDGTAPAASSVSPGVTALPARGNSENNPIQITWSQFSNGNTNYRKEDFINKKFKDSRSNIFYEIIDG